MNEQIAKWLAQFDATPLESLHALVLGRTAVPAWTRSSLREVFIEIWQTHREVLDGAVAGWLEPRIYQAPPERTPEEVWASHLQDVFRAVAGIPLPKVERLLRERLRDFRSWLRPFRYAESCDPEAAFLAALAWATTNHGLEGMWQGLALRKEKEPAYYTDLGLLGLIKRRDEQGNLPAKATFLLRATLMDLADSSMSRDDWELTTRALLASYHWNPETWVREFEPVLEARPHARNGLKWLRRILPGLTQPQATPQAHPIPLHESNAMVRAVTDFGTNAEGLGVFLSRHRSYADASSDPHFLVRTFNRLAEVARYRNSDWSIARAEETLAWDEGNARNWTVLARCLWARGRRAHQDGDAAAAKVDCREAIDTLWKARFRFPHNAFVRTELAKMLRAAGDSATSEAVYRETKNEFPKNPWCLTGLADLLLQLNRETNNRSQREEAIALFEGAEELGDTYARQRLQALDRHDDEAEERVSLPAPSLTEMRPAQRLGRALLCQWQAVQAQSSGERDRYFAQAEELLALPDASAGECRVAFIEARGFLLLARDRSADAKTYFVRQLATFAPRRPLGLRLGITEARARLREPLDDLEATELESFGPSGSILPLILKVLRLLEVENSDAALRDALMRLYPEVQRLLGMPASELGEEEEPRARESTPTTAAQQSADTMLARLVAENIFQAAGISNRDAFQSAEVLSKTRSATRSSRDVLFSATEKLALVA